MAVDIERALLKKITDPIGLRECYDRGVRVAMFEDPFNRGVYEFAIMYWMRTGKMSAPSRDVLMTEFDPEDKGKLKLEDTEESLHWLIDQILSRFQTNQAQDILRRAAKLTVSSPKEALDLLYQDAWQAKEQSSPRHTRSNMAETGEDRIRLYSERQQQGADRGAPLGFPEIDDFVGGVIPGEVSLIVAATKTGKSWALVKAAVEAHRSGVPFRPYIATLELPIPQFEERIDALYSGVGYGKLQRGDLDREDYRRLQAAHEDLKSHGPFYLERPDRGERTVVNLANRARELECNYLIIDQLSWLEPTKSNYNSERDKYRDLVFDLKEEVSRASAGELATLMAVQFNREGSKKGSRAVLEDIAEASYIEQTIDMAFGLSRDEEVEANNSMVMSILGSRRTDRAQWMLGWYLNRETRLFVRERMDREMA